MLRRASAANSTREVSGIDRMFHEKCEEKRLQPGSIHAMPRLLFGPDFDSSCYTASRRNPA